ncbi:hypothetical protein BATDEDRAFT_90541 [Batrachochytrium dendrobatidis JAM81]|uniref:EF-hand domain-containing protein n=2 Tax=Batrachochytrium dendrobatidis TaxID=109871 RepID=F4P850_BATDJ|nr:uncharacterized protein BATDEDRAFT_90541 [Batrachochytrium dendrobatidis JAM81]EGF78746.1 hypothetical protein BATDEDRAFT_90541 [Batrachochytrium dendrobatidis JAM81]KAJ8323898.1 hypothetical protein O5D80_007129 [Batrachochytrium dendrobatidis]KAK5664708.1 hypothetical protein QVD99_008256 [Batrachochytrium dendrobatidis]OAJ43732.1 hypothetical protein BDEG_27061 [Batrachochytrium dendrobatidis JEL423]|eukprot:XP_006680960.1 hypothetical protein BATDEDRAFT_90541 [Batrachochytrium dendrobatidis JAM81]
MKVDSSLETIHSHSSSPVQHHSQPLVHPTTPLTNKYTDEARQYLEKHRILEIVQQLTTSLLIEKPVNPQEFMIRKLEAMRVARARNQNHVLFTRANIVALYKIFDITGRGYISIEQYREAMMTIGASKYNPKPLGYGVNRISSDTFADEALTALRKL